jgi:wyosine [tRNA(Phe)-imidazoG37] synthetase (radical SAM superfamily)
MRNIIFGIIGIGGIAGIAYLWTAYANRKFDIIHGVQEIAQKIKEIKIKEIETKQVEIVKRIEDNEKLNETIKSEIKEIKKKANIEIKKVLEKDNFSDLVDEVDNLW